MKPLSRFALSLFSLAMLASTAATVHAALPQGVAAGDATDHSAMLWARSTVVGSLRFELSRQADFSDARVIDATVKDPLLPVKRLADGLAAATTYYYRATDGEGNTAQGQFRTLAVADSQAGLSFGVSGDARPELTPYPALRNAVDAGLDFFVCLGDCIYAENYSAEGTPTAKTLKEYREQYIRTLASQGGMNTWRQLRQSTAHYATIDDHEVINDFSGGASPASDARFDQHGEYINETHRYAVGLRAFQNYLPVADEFYPEGGDSRDGGKRKLYRARTLGKDAMFALLDNRSYRDAPLAGVTDPTDSSQVGAFLYQSLTMDRTLLGGRQLADLKADLLAAQQAGVVWKFVMVPEPIENLGVVGAPDRYEGYAKERTELLKYIHDEGIKNVVFISADIHGTLVNNITYEETPMGAKIDTGAFEVVTGPIAFDQPFGPTVVELAANMGLLSPQQLAYYNSLPVANDADSDVDDKDDFLKSLVNQLVTSLGYDPIGLEGSSIDATLLKGDYLATHTYGWTRFDVDGASKKLTVTTYGVPAYTLKDIQANMADITAMKPKIVSRFVVKPKQD